MKYLSRWASEAESYRDRRFWMAGLGQLVLIVGVIAVFLLVLILIEWLVPGGGYR